MGETVLAIMLAAGLGLVAGGYYSVMGWIVLGNLLLITTASSTLAAHAPFLLSLGWAGLILLAFNLGLVVSLTIRHTAVLRGPQLG